MTESRFSRNIRNIELLKEQLENDPFLKKVMEQFVYNKTACIKGKGAFIALRNNEATIYYQGRRFCNIKMKAKHYVSFVYEKYLPIQRSIVEKPAYIDEPTWKERTGIAHSYAEIIPEIVSHMISEQRPEAAIASRLYRYSPYCAVNSKFLLLDIEVSFSNSREDNEDRIDALFYNTETRQLSFVEIKRSIDGRLKITDTAEGTESEAIKQLKRYRKRLNAEKQNMIDQYNNVIEIYNQLTSRTEETRIPEIDRHKEIGLCFWVVGKEGREYQSNLQNKDIPVFFVESLEGKKLAELLESVH